MRVYHLSFTSLMTSLVINFARVRIMYFLFFVLAIFMLIQFCLICNMVVDCDITPTNVLQAFLIECYWISPDPLKSSLLSRPFWLSGGLWYYFSFYRFYFHSLPSLCFNDKWLPIDLNLRFLAFHSNLLLVTDIPHIVAYL